MNITKYKNLNMTENKTDMGVTKINKYNKLNMTECKIVVLNTKTDHNRTQNRHENY